MADSPESPGPPDDDRPLGLAGYLDEEAEWEGLMGRVHRSIARREASGQAVELTMQGLTGIVIEYVRAIVEAFGSGRGGRRVE